jgi:hypothetical protein
MNEAFKKDGSIYWDIRNEFVAFTESEKDRIGKEYMSKVNDAIFDHFGKKDTFFLK